MRSPMGFNQVIMIALAMIVIASLIGTRGLGREVLIQLDRLRLGRALEVGLDIAVLAVVLDRLGNGMVRRAELPGRIAPAMRWLASALLGAAGIVGAGDDHGLHGHHRNSDLRHDRSSPRDRRITQRPRVEDRPAWLRRAADVAQLHLPRPLYHAVPGGGCVGHCGDHDLCPHPTCALFGFRSAQYSRGGKRGRGLGDTSFGFDALRPKRMGHHHAASAKGQAVRGPSVSAGKPESGLPHCRSP